MTKIVYVNCRLINDYEKDLCSNDHYFKGSRKEILSVGLLAWASWSMSDSTEILLLCFDNKGTFITCYTKALLAQQQHPIFYAIYRDNSSSRVVLPET